LLNQDQFKGAEILIAGPNFGCGSSQHSRMGSGRPHGAPVGVGHEQRGDRRTDNAMTDVHATDANEPALTEGATRRLAAGQPDLPWPTSRPQCSTGAP
jgi:hypothetical protein